VKSFWRRSLEEKAERPKRDTEIREHLANERTLLAWVRTGVGLISVGFVVERAGALVAGSRGGGAEASEIFGVVMVALGCITLIAGSIQFFRNRRMIREGVFLASTTPYMVVVVGSLLLAGAFIVYALLEGS
jgi:putative membrane protein